MTGVAAPFVKMAQNNAYANATLYTALLGLSAEAFTAPRPGFFGSLARTLNHIHEVDLYYLDAVEEGGRGLSVFQRAQEPDLRVLATGVAGADGRLIAFCKRLDFGRLAHRVAIERQGRFVHETVEDVLLHLFQHQIHHRGQAHVQAQDVGIAPPQLDEFHLENGRAPMARAILEKG